MEKLLIANWKSHKKLQAASQWVEQFTTATAGKNPRGTVVVAPPFSLLQTVQEAIEGFEAPLILGAQDVSKYPFGKYTGEVAAASLADLGVRYVLVGHSERRRHFNETNQEVAAKVSQVLEAGLIPVVCVDREYVQDQAAALASDQLEKVLVAYEPVEAVGTGNNQDVGVVQEVVKEIRQAFGEVRVLYGGSVTEFNVGEYLLVCDGVLVGGASLEVSDFFALTYH
jgi:triosephosphate isomerase (TIM)